MCKSAKTFCYRGIIFKACCWCSWFNNRALRHLQSRLLNDQRTWCLFYSLVVQIFPVCYFHLISRFSFHKTRKSELTFLILFFHITHWIYNLWCETWKCVLFFTLTIIRVRHFSNRRYSLQESVLTKPSL